jgi:hypothetical protein
MLKFWMQNNKKLIQLEDGLSYTLLTITQSHLLLVISLV